MWRLLSRDRVRAIAPLTFNLYETKHLHKPPSPSRNGKGGVVTLTQTEIASLRIAIAEEMGWHAHSELDNTWNAPHQICALVSELIPLPLYTTSIDVIREAAMEKFMDNLDASRFAYALYFAIHEDDRDNVKIWQLTALDWAIAFARTAKIWKYKV